MERLTAGWHHAARVGCFPGQGCDLKCGPIDTAMGIEIPDDGLVAVGALHPGSPGEACLSLSVQPEFWDAKFVEALLPSLIAAAISQGRLRLRTQVPLEATHGLDIFKVAGLTASSAVLLGGSTELEPVPQGTQSGQMLRITQPVPRIAEDRGQAMARVRSEAEDKLHALAARYLPDQRAEVLVQSEEDTAATIARAVEGLPADLIVMGTHSRTGVRHALLGSVAESVVRQSKVPVLVTGPNMKAVASSS